ncbi:unnamed protein product, partial [Mesocestoides corti]
RTSVNYEKDPVLAEETIYATTTTRKQGAVISLYTVDAEATRTISSLWKNAKRNVDIWRSLVLSAVECT